jgi:cytochrome P450
LGGGVIAPPKDAAHRIAPGPRGHFLVGNLLEFRRDVLRLLLDSRREFGDVVRFRLGPMLIHMVSHPDHVKQVLITNQRCYNKETRSSAKIAGITGEGLLTSNGDFWLRQRRLMQPVFQTQRLTPWTGQIVEATDQTLESWQKQAAAGQPLDVASEMMRLTCTVVARILFGADVARDLDVVEDSATVAMQHTWKRLERIVDVPLWLPTPGNLRFRRAMHRLHAIVSRIIEKQGTGGEDLLSLLLKARDDETGAGMTEEQLRNETITLLLAGHETTANALSWTWYLLAQHPQWAQALRDELEALLAGRPPGVEDLPRLDLVTRVFQEAMRLYPPIWIMERRVLEDDVLGGYHIPAGSALEISPYVIHRHPDFWHDPERFDPERFTPSQTAARPSCAYLPFGAGQRLCIGSQLALLEARVIITRVVQRFRLELVPGFAVTPQPGITLRPRHGLRMTLHPVKG